MKSPHPPAPTRFSNVHKGISASAESACHYTVSGAWLCHPGRVRRANEDACVAGTKLYCGSSQEAFPISVHAGPWIVAVSDGIGGHRAGAEASREVVQALADCDRVTPLGVSNTLHRLNRHLCELGHKNSDLSAMGATVAGIGCGSRGLFAFNVGDSRVYAMENGRLVQITRDDSEAEDLIDQGLLQPCDGPRPGFLHALTQAIGGREEVVEIEPHLHPLPIESQGRFLICSDGLTDMLHTPDIEAILLAEENNEVAAAMLFEHAMHAGGMDNITVAVVDVRRR